MKKTLALSAALALAVVSHAAIAAGPGGFIRGEVGSSDVELRDGLVRSDDEDTSAVFAGGYWFNPNFGVEGHAGTLYNTALEDDYELDLVSIGVGLVAKKNFGPDGNGFFLGGRAGIARMTVQIREDFDVEEDEHSTKPYVGLSAGYDVSDRFGFSLNFDRRQADFDGAEVDVDTIAVGGEYRF